MRYIKKRIAVARGHPHLFEFFVFELGVRLRGVGGVCSVLGIVGVLECSWCFWTWTCCFVESAGLATADPQTEAAREEVSEGTLTRDDGRNRLLSFRTPLTSSSFSISSIFELDVRRRGARGARVPGLLSLLDGLQVQGLQSL